MKQTDVTVTFYLKKSEMNDEGHCPVMAKLVVGKFSEAAFSAKMSVPAALWASGRATGKSNAAREINRQLDDLRASAISIYDELSATRENVTAEEIRNLLLGTAFGQETLLGYFRTFIEHFEKRVGVNREKGTAQSYRYACNCVAAFIQEKYKLSDVPFTALNRSFIDNYDLYLRTERRFALGTIVLLVTRLNTIVGEAIAEGIITARKQLVILCIASLICGAYDGFYGPGAGTFMLLAFTLWAKMGVRSASGTMKAVNLASNIAAFATFALSGEVIWLLGLTAGIFGIAGHYIGAGLVLQNGTKIVRPIIGAVLAVLFVKTAWGLLS